MPGSERSEKERESFSEVLGPCKESFGKGVRVVVPGDNVDEGEDLPMDKVIGSYGVSRINDNIERGLHVKKK